MMELAMEIRRNGREIPRKVSIGASLEGYCRRRWARETASYVSSEWDLSIDEAREVVRGRASKNVLEKIWSHHRGGWGVMLLVMEPVVGIRLSDWLEHERERVFRHIDEVNALDFSVLEGRA